MARIKRGIEQTSPMKQLPLTQQEFLRNTMASLDMTREAFAARIAASPRRLANWLLPTGSQGFRELDAVIWRLLREIVAAERKKARPPE